LMIWGEKNIPNKSVGNGIWVTDSLMNKLGFKTGDKIVAVNGDSIQYFDDIQTKILIGGKTVLIERDGKNETIELPVNIIGKLVSRKDKKRTLIMPRIPALVGAYDEK